MSFEQSDDIARPLGAEVSVPESQTFLERHGLSPVTFALLSLLVIFILYQLVGGTVTFFLFGGRLRPENIQGLRLATMGAQVVLILVPTILLVRLQSGNLRIGLRLHATGSRQILFAVIGVLSLQQLLQLYMAAQDQLPIPQSVRPVVDQLRKLIEETYKNLVSAHSVPELLYVLVVVAIVPAFCEELLFRGFVQKNFEAGLRKSWGIIVSGIIFGAYHLNPFSFVPLALLGIYFGFLVYHSGSTLTSIVAHFANNLFAVIAAFFNADESLLLAGEAPHLPVSTVVYALVGFGSLFLLSTLAFLRSTRPSAELSA